MPKRSRSVSPLGQNKTRRIEPEKAERKMVTVLLFWEGEYGPIPGLKPRPGTRQSRHRRTARMLVDSGANVPILNEQFVNSNGRVPTGEREHPQKIRDAAGQIIEGAGKRFTQLLTMRMGDHQEELAWEVGPLEEGIDGYLPVGWLIKHNPDIDWEIGTIQWRSQYCKQHCLPIKPKCLIKQFVQMLEESKPFLTQEEREARIATIWHDESGGDIAKSLPEQYREWVDVFSEEKITALPEHSNFDHEITLVEGAKLPKGAIYPLAERELEELRKYLKQMEESGKIRRSQSPSASPFLFVPKPDGSCRPIVDYRALNAATVKDATPLPLMNEIRERLSTAKIFTKIDLKNGYNLIRIAEGHEWKTAFRTRYGLYEYLVMPQGLCNVLAAFQRMMDTVFAGIVDNGVIIYLDDILIYSETEEEHMELVKEVLSRLRKYNLCAAIKKSYFHVSEVEFLGYMISPEGISMSERKVESIRDWKRPKTVKNIQEFLGFVNFYRRFIEGFSKIAHPLITQTKKGLTFEWTDKCQEAFETLKQRFISVPILKHFKSQLPTEVETDTSDFALGAIMSQ